MTKQRCQTCGQWFEDEELDEHLQTHLDEPEKPVKDKVPLKCPDCNVDTEAYYDVPFRVGRGDLAARFFLGVWSELDPVPLLVDLYICPKCGRMQQFAGQKTRSKLMQASKRGYMR